MKNTRSFFKNCTLLLLLFLPLILSGCVDDGNSNCDATYTDLQIVTHWPAEAAIPSGIRVLFYPEGQNTYVLFDLPAEGGTIRILTGNYSIAIVNNDSQRIIYTGRDKYTNYTASTPTTTVVLPQRPDITTAFASPDNLWLATYDTYKVTTTTNIIDVYPVDQVYQYNIIARMTGIEYVTASIGAVTLLKHSILLSDTNIPPAKGSALLEATKIEDGVRYSFRSFGIVSGDSHEIAFIVNTHSKTYQYNIDITAQLNAIPFGGTIYLTDEIVIEPDTLGEDGFNVSLGGWNKIPVPLPPIIATPE